MNRNVTLFAITMLLFGGMQTNLFGMYDFKEPTTENPDISSYSNVPTKQPDEELEEQEEQEVSTPTNSNQQSNGKEKSSLKNLRNWPRAAFRWTFGKNAWTKKFGAFGKIKYEEDTSTFTKLANLPSHFNKTHEILSTVASKVVICGVLALPTYYILNRGNRAKLALLAQKNNQLSQQVTAIQQLLNKQTAGLAATK